MYRPDAEKLFEELCQKHGLVGWTFEWSDRFVSTKGMCRHASKTISIGARYNDRATNAQVSNTIRHEIAHAVEFERHGASDHGKRWKSVCLEVGALPVRCTGDGPDISRRPATKASLKAKLKRWQKIEAIEKRRLEWLKQELVDIKSGKNITAIERFRTRRGWTGSEAALRKLIIKNKRMWLKAQQTRYENQHAKCWKLRVQVSCM